MFNYYLLYSCILLTYVSNNIVVGIGEPKFKQCLLIYADNLYLFTYFILYNSYKAYVSFYNFDNSFNNSLFFNQFASVRQAPSYLR